MPSAGLADTFDPESSCPAGTVASFPFRCDARSSRAGLTVVFIDALLPNSSVC